MRVPVNVGWLCENDKLLDTIRLTYPNATLGKANQKGILVNEDCRCQVFYQWTENFLLKLDQLKKLGFE